MFIDKLIGKIEKVRNPSVLGLDPLIEYVPEYLRNESYKIYGKNLAGCANAILEFNRQIIDEICDCVPAVKLQLGCYEMYGIEGMITFNETVKYARQKGLLVIADGKRNDIGSSAACYSKAYLGKTIIEDVEESVFDVDALTVSPYLGVDGIKPFVDDCVKYDKGIFVLVKTSNKSSGQLQDLSTDGGRTIYEVMAGLVNEWSQDAMGKNGYSSVGAVVGATYPEQAKVLRNVMKRVYFLVPGYGAQGGTAKDVVHSFDENGRGAIVNASRSLMCAYKSDLWKDKFGETEFAKAARAEAVRMRDEINVALVERG